MFEINTSQANQMRVKIHCVDKSNCASQKYLGWVSSPENRLEPAQFFHHRLRFKLVTIPILMK